MIKRFIIILWEYVPKLHLSFLFKKYENLLFVSNLGSLRSFFFFFFNSSPKVTRTKDFPITEETG